MTNVIILKQTHASKAILKSYPNITESLLPELYAVAKSQFKIIKFVQNKKNVPVILEDSASFKRGDIKYQAHVLAVKNLFPNGLPKLFDQLNSAQVKYLGVYGAKFYLVYKNIIDQTYSDFTDKIGRFNNTDIPFADIGQEHLEREYLSLMQAVQVAKDTKSKEVILIYGAYHEFIDVAKCIPAIQITVKDFKVIPKTLYFITPKRPLVSCDQLENLGQAFGYTLPLPPANQPIPYNPPKLLSNTQLITDSANNFVMYGTIALGGLLLVGLFGKCCSRRKAHNKLKSHTDNQLELEVTVNKNSIAKTQAK